MSIILSPPEPGDMGWIISKHGEIYAREFGIGEPFELDIAAKVTAFYQKKDFFRHLFIARVGGKRAGSIAVSTLSRTTGFINFLLVVPKFRNQGLAQHLISHVIEISRAQGLGRLRLETYGCLVGARRLYAKNGFKILETQSDFNAYGQNFDREFWECAI